MLTKIFYFVSGKLALKRKIATYIELKEAMAAEKK